jgi:hypothetical protein
MMAPNDVTLNPSIFMLNVEGSPDIIVFMRKDLRNAAGHHVDNGKVSVSYQHFLDTAHQRLQTSIAGAKLQGRVKQDADGPEKWMEIRDAADWEAFMHICRIRGWEDCEVLVHV